MLKGCPACGCPRFIAEQDKTCEPCRFIGALRLSELLALGSIQTKWRNSPETAK